MNWFYVVAFGYYWVWMMLMMVVLDCVFVRKFISLVPYVVMATAVAGVLTINLYMIPGMVFSNSMELIICIILSIFVCKCYEGIKYQMVSFVVMYFVSTILLEMLMTSIVQYISHMLFGSMSDIIVAGTQRSIFLFSISLVYVLCLLKCRNKTIGFKESKVYFLVNIFNITGGIAVVYFTRIYVDPFELDMMLKWVPLIVFALAIFSLIIWMNIVSLEKRKIDIIQMKTQMLEQNLDRLLQDNRAIEIIKHDLKKHLFVIEQKLVGGKTEETLEYIRSIETTLTTSQYNVWTGDVLIDSVLNYMKNNAEKIGCTVKISSENLENILIEREEVSVLLLNLLENAIEACEKIQNDEKWIHISIYLCNEIVSLQIKNTISEEPILRDGKYISSKKGKKLHGWGLESVQEVIRRQEGYLKFNVTKDSFEVLVNLPGKMKED